MCVRSDPAEDLSGGMAVKKRKIVVNDRIEDILPEPQDDVSNNTRREDLADVVESPGKDSQHQHSKREKQQNTE